MAFVPRKRKDKFVFEESSINKPSNSETLKKGSINSEELISNLKGNKSYLDMTIEVLNILETRGIDIYDTSRTPGMYQRGQQGVEEVNINNVIKSLSKDNKKSEGYVEDEKLQTQQKTENINNLLNFFKKDK